MIELKDVTKTYQMGAVPVQALRGVSLSITPGEYVAIMGPSGSGKSTLMHVMGLLDVPDSGSYELFGKQVSGLSEDELAVVRTRVIGFVFQQFHLLARTPADQNVALPLLYSGKTFQGGRAAHLLQQVGLGERLHHRPNELSGGQQQRVAIARALVNEPRILFADEPTGNLDSQSEKEIMALLEELNRRGITIILVTHETEIARHAKRVIRMRDGRIQSDERNEAPAPSDPVAVSWGASEKKIRAADLVEHFRQGVKSLLANKVRSGLSMLGILIGVAAVIAMLALGTGAQKSIESQLASMGSNLLVLRSGARRTGGVAGEAGASARMRIDDIEALQQEIPGIRRIAPSVSGGAQVVWGNKNWNTRVTGTVTAYAEMRASHPIAGRFFSENENRMRQRVAVLGLTVVRELFGGTNPIGEFVKINKINFQVIGVLPEKGSSAGGFRDQDDTILVPLLTAMYRVLGKQHLDAMDIEIADASQIENAQDSIVGLMAKRHRVPPSQTDAFQVHNLAEIQEALSESSRIMAGLLASIAAISLLVGGIGIMNIMLVSVSERTREIGLRKAVGATRFDILAQFLIEAVVISVIGGLAGILLGWLATLLMASLAGWAATVSVGSVVLSFAFSAGIGILFGIWPARKASLLNPITALRYE